MDKEIVELLDKLLEKLTKTTTSKPCKILIENDGEKTKLEVEGCRLSVLLTLAGAEKSILEELSCTDEEFDLVKKIVGTKEVDNG